jgi:hypothetical protein
MREQPSSSLLVRALRPRFTKTDFLIMWGLDALIILGLLTGVLGVVWVAAGPVLGGLIWIAYRLALAHRDPPPTAATSPYETGTVIE